VRIFSRFEGFERARQLVGHSPVWGLLFLREGSFYNLP
jgi:hypothetical protein